MTLVETAIGLLQPLDLTKEELEAMAQAVRVLQMEMDYNQTVLKTGSL